MSRHLTAIEAVDRTALIAAMKAEPDDAEVWRGDAGDLCIGFEPKDGMYEWVGAVAEWLETLEAA